jgi:hypothetical protein
MGKGHAVKKMGERPGSEARLCAAHLFRHS